jgi:outer membrane protein OmpA-like peptidoglycan-associated protein
MKVKSILVIVACAGLLASCATTAPIELVNAREAYRQASTGPAVQVAPAQLHEAQQALAIAEQSFQKNPKSYQTQDLAYVAHRKAQLAQASASIAQKQASQAQARRDYQDAQSKIIAETKTDLDQTRTALAASERSGEVSAERLSSAQDARIAADRQTAQAQEALAASTAQQLASEQEARKAAEKRAADAQAALAKLATVREEARGMVITLSGSVLFATNQSTLLPDAQLRLNKVADALLVNNQRNLIIEGHADSSGDAGYNLDLSLRRANTVRSYLVGRGYQASRIRAYGFGERNPVADNASAEGRANNRRVEIVVEHETIATNK